MKPSRDISALIDIMAALRTPGSGCPWDLEQNFSTIAPYTIEEAYEVADAIGPIAGFVAALVMVLTIAVPSFALAALSFFLIGAGPVIWVISTTTLRQSVTPQNLLGRVSATGMVAYGARPVGAAIGALVGGLYGPEACLVLAAGGFLFQALLFLASPVPRLVRQPAMAA